jgi:predicted aconitase with swiveling domain
LIFRGRGLVRGRGRGPLLVSEEPLSFYGGVDPLTGEIVERGHELYGRSVAGAILVFPYGKGSTVGSYTLLRLARRGKAPAGIVNLASEPIVVVGCMLGGIPLMDSPDPNPIALKRELEGREAELVVEGGAGLLKVVADVRGEEEGP